MVALKIVPFFPRGEFGPPADSMKREGSKSSQNIE